MQDKIKKIVERNNCIYNGILKGPDYNLILYTEPFFESTLAIKEKEFTEARLIKEVALYRCLWYRLNGAKHYTRFYKKHYKKYVDSFIKW